MADLLASPPQRMSRYRSQRKAQEQQQAEETPAVPAIPQDDAQQEEGIVRSKSRYHRKNAANEGYDGGRPTTARPAEAQDQEQIDVAPRRKTKAQSPPHRTSRSPPVRPAQAHRRTGSNAQRNRERHASPPAELGASQDSGTERKHDDRRRDKANSNERRPEPVTTTSLSKLHSNQSQLSGELWPPIKPEPVRPAASPVKVDGPPTSDKINATKSMSALPKYVDSDDGGGCFGLFKRKRGEATPSNAEKTPIARPTGPQTIMPGGGGVVPGTDAPISAVNAGDRRVLVECGKSKMMFPVTTTTTPVDLIRSASTTMSERVDVKSAVLLEFFGTVGVQRPLRRYEHIRDVMNSWDTDRQNSLLLVDPGTGSSEVELSLAGVPKSKPEENSWLLSYSQKVGKWDKRMITLHPSGQLTAQRDPNKPQNQENVCHLSDFDIYTPTREKLKKKIKPPKKMCFAVKSQQKSSMFESTQNFVHFFCTNDRRTGDEFYEALQAWRSWYLVNIMGEGKKEKPKPKAEEAVVNGSPDYGRSNGDIGGHRKMESLDSHYQLGSFKPLVDMDQFDYDKRPTTARSQSGGAGGGGFTKAANQFDTTISPERRTSTVKKKALHPPVALHGKAQLAEDEPLANIGRRPSVDRRRRPSLDGKQRRPSLDGKRQNTDEFNENGLLGRRYSQRQKEYVEKETKRAQPFTNGPNLLNGSYDDEEDDYPKRASLDMPCRNLSVRAAAAHKATSNGDLRRQSSKRGAGDRGSVDLGRTSSRSGRGPPKPLVDLTPQYREPIHHARKGKGHVPEQPGVLVEAATSPEDPLGIPPSTDWRGRSAQNSPDVRPNTSRARSQSRTPQQQPDLQPSKSVRRPGTSKSPDAPQPFDANGLLAHAKSGWGGGDKGRPVMDGSHAKGPMLDMSEQSRFAQGSLLNKVERVHGRDGPLIDREKREERDEKYGEGY